MSILVFLVVSFLTFSVSCTTSHPIPTSNFLHCLTNHSTNSVFPITEAIHTYHNTSYQSVLFAYIRNRRFSTPKTPKPLAIVAAKHESHVQSTVICAQQNGYNLRIRSGGHDFEGLSYVSSVENFVMLDMSNLRSVDVNVTDESVWVESGATLGELYFNIGNKSNVHGFPAGVCPSVGVGGHLSGGGYGNLMRKYGLTVDNVVDAKLVDANGKILDRKSMGEDLFWAIRGGGGASFGVVVSWKIKLVRVPKKVTVFIVPKSLEQDAIDILHQWQYVAPKLPKEVFIRAKLQVNQNDILGKVAMEVSFICHYLGDSKELVALVNKWFPELGLKKSDCFEMSWVESIVFWYNHPVEAPPISILLDRPIGPPDFFKAKSDYVKNPIPKHAIKSIIDVMLKPNLDKLYMEWNPYGGRMSEISNRATPFPHRKGNLFLIQYLGYWKEDNAELARSYLEVIGKMYEEMTPFVSKNPREAFLNYRDLDLGINKGNFTNVEVARVYGRMYFMENFDRLVRVKSAVDPGNFFKNEQSIYPTTI